MQLPPANGIVTLLTDFGLRDPYVGIMKGMIKRRHVRADVIDVCHDVPAQAIDVGALFLGASVERFPAGTVHVSVVDPGVGTERRVLVACAAGCYWVSPDNGLLTSVLQGPGPIEVRAADVDALKLRAESATFHGRDIFAPLGAMLCSGRYGFRAVGPRITDPVMLPESTNTGPVILAVDHFGNLISGVRESEVAEKGVVAVDIAGQRVALHRTYQDVEPGSSLALVNSYGLLEVAISGGNAAESFGVDRGAPLTLIEG